MLPDDGAEEWGLGWSVALDGDTAIIGAGDTDSCQYGTCSDGVYVFTRTGTAWNEQAKLIPGDEYIGEGYGRYIVLNDDTALIGAPYDDDNGEDSGSVYVFTRTDHTWTEQAQLLAKDGTSDDNFGMAVALDGGTAVMAAPNYRPTGFSDASGMAYVFTRTGSTWTQQSNLASNDLSPNVGFGESVAIDGNTVVIGAPTDHDPGEFDPYGSAYIFTRLGNTWAQQAKLLPNGYAYYGLFGSAVAVDDDKNLVGARRWRPEFPKRELFGSSYLFIRTGNTPHQVKSLFERDGEAYNNFGSAVAIQGETILIGAPGGENAEGIGTGATYSRTSEYNTFPPPPGARVMAT